ncbi:MAG: rhodanese-like domain-containing protein [Candidatus Carbobacillus altaicus]|uniref:Rhodanese-like domain protein n=1 Tax=Candidatus Carbonibacillus altaicus TaxID=2163959 RepID=A0A2R6Y0K8_9BACL|nr:rhodanese-like domain-containing protein [Candidatus Carbobacillus altaicus]PTQ56204.1 MAG: Rhodanese-like domain protein [Candidatus Carbobacillus altaicus]
MFERHVRVATVTPEEVKNRLEAGEDIVILDVREAMEVAMGKIPGAKHIPLSELPQRIHEIERDKETILVCRSGNRSHFAAEFLQQNGFPNVKNMLGGMISWDGDIE